MTLQRLPVSEAMSAFEIPNTRGKISTPLWDKVKFRALTAHKHIKYNIMVKQGNTWYAPPEIKEGISGPLNMKKYDLVTL